MRIRFICLVLAGLLILPAVFSCGKEPAEVIDHTTTNEPDTEESESGPQSSLPKDLVFSGETIRILNGGYGDDYLTMEAADQTGDVVNDAIYNRNLSVQSKLDVKLEYINVGGENFNDAVTKSVQAGADDYDIVAAPQHNIVGMTINRLFANLKNAPYIDLEKPWWDKAFIDEISVGEKLIYFVTGDITLNVIRNMGCIYYNKQMYRDSFGDPDEMYATVLDGKWTFDKFASMAKVMYKDLNGNGKPDDDDQYGVGLVTDSLSDHLALASGVRFSQKDSNGIPMLTMNNERTVNFVQKLHELFYANEGSRVFPSNNDTAYLTLPGKFSRNELLFEPGWFYTSELLRDMPGDYGIIPFPKLDESIPNYLSLAHDVLPLFALPTTCNKVEASCAVLEQMAFEGYRDVVPAFYEVALKKKYIRDSNDAALKIIDMIRAGCTTDFVYVYGYALNNIGYIMRDLARQKKSDFVSMYEKQETAAKAKLTELVEIYLDYE